MFATGKSVISTYALISTSQTFCQRKYISNATINAVEIDSIIARIQHPGGDSCVGDFALLEQTVVQKSEWVRDLI
jgi:hypothetical protein